MKEVCKNCVCYNDGWCEAFVVQKLPNIKGCFGFIPKEKEGYHELQAERAERKC